MHSLVESSVVKWSQAKLYPNLVKQSKEKCSKVKRSSAKLYPNVAQRSRV